MKAKQLREMTEGELLQRVDDLRQSIFNLRVKATTKDLTNTSSMQQERQNLARVMTVLREKGLKV
ncbi:MAG: 50S ribosomal protein L29 [Candidatus Sumerlaeota bacterium]|nr:50S ribosomal protein L29 [Candidatus Sumerlaeota bacterium]